MEKPPNLGAVSIRHSQMLCGADIVYRDLARPAVFLCIERDFLAFDVSNRSGDRSILFTANPRRTRHAPAAVVALA
ncbi:MAG: hypothetical protein WCD69_26900 [Xanthobacteraceae bacterium]